MKNTAEIYNDGVCVYFNSCVRPDTIAKIALVAVNIFFVGFYVVITILMSGEKLSGFPVLAWYIIIPCIYAVSLGRSTLWNFFGKENIIINAKSISFYRSYGFFTTPFNLLQYRNLYYEIIEQQHYNNIPYGTIQFIDHNKMDIPIVIFSSTVYVPIEKLHDLVSQLGFVFSIEHLTNTGSDIVNLN